jgi:hypothetical protein
MIRTRKLSIFVLLLMFTPTFAFAGQFKVGCTTAGHDIEIKVRLVGIDAPETSKKKRQ